MSQTETEQAAANLGAAILAQAEGKFPIGVEQDQPEVVEATPPVSSSPPPAAAAASFQDPLPPPKPTDPEPAVVEQDPPDPYDFTPLPDDELDELLAEAAIDDQVEAEVEAEEAEYGESYDPDEARRAKKDAKRIEYLEQQLVAKSRKDWVAENLRKYPLLNTYFADEVKGIDATSRRGFAKAAAALNDTYSRALAKPLADIEALRSGTKTAARAEARKEAAVQWGAPTGDPAGSAAAETTQAIQSELEEARSRGASLHERLAIMAKAKPVF